MTTSPSSSKFYIALIVIIGLVGGYVGYSQWLKPAEASIPPLVISNPDGLKAFTNLKIDLNILDDSAYKGLITSGESPVNPGVTGKKDIFAP